MHWVNGAPAIPSPKARLPRRWPLSSAKTTVNPLLKPTRQFNPSCQLRQNNSILDVSLGHLLRHEKDRVLHHCRSTGGLVIRLAPGASVARGHCGHGHLGFSLRHENVENEA